MTVKTARSALLRLDLERFLPYRLNVVAEAVSQALSRLYGQRYGIGVPEWRVLATLGQYRGMTAKQIGAHSRMHKTKVSRAVAGLEERGFLSREANPADMREAFLALTPEGDRIYRDLVPEVMNFAAALTADLTSQERQLFDNLLLRIEATARNLVGRS
jgi:DNA-binding MarR family transcriptional regulator